MQPPRLRQLAASMGPMLILLGMLVWSAQAGPTEVSTSVILINLSDMEVNAGDNLTLCEQVVWNSTKGFNAKKINFVPTIQAIGSEEVIGQYFYKSGYDANRVTVSKIMIERYRKGIQRCFQAAVDAGFTLIHIVPHVDPFQEDGRYIWRNLVAFHPLNRQGPDELNSFSYFETLLQPVAQALNAVINNNTVVEFAITAEQGASVFTWPNEWRKAIADTRAILAKGKDASKHYFGISFNWNKVCGCVEPNESDPLLYNATYTERYERFVASGGLDNIDLDGVKTLLSEIDQIGCSGYANYPHNGEVPDVLEPATMERSLETVAFEFETFGIDLKDLLFNQNKSFVYSEQGLGGTTAFGKIAPNITFVAQHPFWGNWPWAGYNKTEDPWQIPSYRQYRRDLYSNLTAWAVQGGGPQYKIDGIFVWNVGTWDVHGVYPSSTNKQGSFGDPFIRDTIAAGNLEVNGAVKPRVPVTVDRVLPVLPRPRNHTVLADGTVTPPEVDPPPPPVASPPPPPPAPVTAPPSPPVAPNVAAARLPTKTTPMAVPAKLTGAAANRTAGANTTATVKVAASPAPKVAAKSPAPKAAAAASPSPKVAASPAPKAAAAASPAPKAAVSPAPKVAAKSPAPKAAAAVSPAPKAAAKSPAPKAVASPAPKAAAAASPAPKVAAKSPAPKVAAAVSPAPKVAASPAPKAVAAASPAPKVAAKSPAPKAAAAVSPAPKAVASPAPKAASSPAPKAAAATSPAPKAAAKSPAPKATAASPAPKFAAVESPAPKVNATRSPAPKAAAAGSPMPKVAASPMPKFAASPMPKFAASPMPKVAASPMPKFAASPMPKFAASPMPKVAASPMPKFAASPMPKVAASPAPKVAAAASPAPKAAVSPAPKVAAKSPAPTAAAAPSPAPKP